ncbi:MAG TPA: hypothetical protein VNO32_18135, partial [Candidatus Acidoferrum sp.]|nr:hypothetical protein [Candidatus Acidoferrum sp.]
EIWGAACALYRLEERVQTESDSGGTDAGQNSGYAVWAHVPEAEHSEGAGGAKPRDHQDRLIKKLRRKGIDSYEAANEYLEKEYLPAHNRRFAIPAAQPEDYHGRKPTARELREIFRLETERGISNDWVIRHEGANLQLKPGSRRYGPTQSKALVCEWEDGTMKVYYRGEAIAFTELKTLAPEKPLPRFPRAPGPWW